MTNWRSSSERWAVVTIAHRGVRSAREQQRVDVERRALAPRGERRRGEQAVELEGQLLAILRREELVELEHAQLLQRWLLDLADERRQVERLLVGPGVLDEVGQQDVLAARQRVGGDADEAEQAGHEALDLVGDRLGVVGVGHLQRSDDVQLDARPRSGRVDREVAGVPQRLDLLGPVAPAGETVRPRLGLGGGEVVGRLAGRLGLALVDPRAERGGVEVGEREAEVGQVALRVDEQGRDPGAEHLLDEHDAEAGLARSGHPDDDAVGGQIGGVERQVGAGALVLGGVDQPAEMEVSHDVST